MSTKPDNSTVPTIPLRALIILVLGLLGAWLAGGSLGWMAPPLQRTCTWLAMATIVIAALPARGRTRVRPTSDNLLLGGATLLAVLMTASAMPVINILAVAVLLAAIYQIRPGLIAQVAGSAALAAMALAAFRLVCDGSAAAWTFTNALGYIEGIWAGWLTGRPLVIGASFGGVDFLVLMAGLTAGWLIATPRPRFERAAWALFFTFLAQSAYLAVLAFSHDLAALLPPQVVAKPDDISHLGVWTWGNALRALLPWSLPWLAAAFHSIVAVAMFRLTAWPLTPYDLPSASDEDSAEGKRRNRNLQGSAALPYGSWSPEMSWQCFGPAGLMIVAAVALTLTPVEPDLTGRKIVAYDDGATDWSTADPGSIPLGRQPRYGLLPLLVEGLGGNFKRSRSLADADLQSADVLIVLPPRSPAGAPGGKPSIPAEIRKQAWKYVAAGGRMIVAGEPETNLGVDENVLNALLGPTAISFRDDTANSLTQRWEYNLQAAPHAATAGSSPGRNHFSLDRAASLRISWPAGPLLVGRWAWDELGTDPERPEALPYSPGDRLGDLVLAAQQKVGRGTVVVLGAAACLSNDGIPFSHTFTAPLLSALAANHPTPLAWWRQLLGILAAIAAIWLLYRQFDDWQAARLRFPLSMSAASAALALALAMMACNLLSNATSQLWTTAAKTSAARPIVLVDGSHLEAMGNDPWGENGTGRLMRVLAGNDYLPLVAPDLSPQRLSRAAMLISIAPAQAFSSSEIATVHDFVEQGGFFLSMVGSPDAEPSRALLEKLQLYIKPMPLPPWVNERETAPLGQFWYPSEEQPQAQFYASWPVSGQPGAEKWSKPVIVGARVKNGQAFLIGDTAFALNKNFDATSPNASFWSYQLKTWLGPAGDKPQIPVGDKPQATEPSEGGIIKVPKL